MLQGGKASALSGLRACQILNFLAFQTSGKKHLHYHLTGSTA
jgi:hypothetical protein